MRRKPYFLTWGFLYEKQPVSPAAAYSKILLTPTSLLTAFGLEKDLWQTLLILDDARSAVSSYSFSPISHIPTLRSKKQFQKPSYRKWLPKDFGPLD